MSSSDKTFCRHPDPNKAGVNIDRWKYDAVSRAILKAVPRSAEGVPYRDLPKQVSSQLTPAQRRELGSIGWYTITVKLDLEARGKLVRIPGTAPQRVRRA